MSKDFSGEQLLARWRSQTEAWLAEAERLVGRPRPLSYRFDADMVARKLVFVLDLRAV
jgi:hypothetical protein